MFNFMLTLTVEKLVWIVVPLSLFIFFAVLCFILIFFDNRSMLKRNLNQNRENNVNDCSVKTVYSKKEDNFSQTEFLPIPENFSTKEFEFEFAGWDKFYVDENGQTRLNSIWTRKPKEYTVKVFGYDKTKPIMEKVVNYGAGVDLNNIVPERPADENFEYKFIGWDKDVSVVEQDLDVYAVFEARIKNMETISQPSENVEPEVVNVQPIESVEHSENDGQVELKNDDKPSEVNEAVASAESQEISSEVSVEVEEVEHNEDMPVEVDDGLTVKEAQVEKIEEDVAEETQIESIEPMSSEKIEENEAVPLSKVDDYDEDEFRPFNNIKVGKPAIIHGIDTTTSTKNGYKVEKSNSIYNSYKINVDNKSSSLESDDIFKRMGVNVRGGSFSENSTHRSDKNLSKNNSGKEKKEVKVEKVEESPEQFLNNTILVSHKKTIKK